MSVLQVLHIPDERLRKVAKPVEEVNAEIQRIVDDMFGKRKLTAVCSHQTRIGNLDAHLI